MSGGLAEDVATILSAVVAQLRGLSDDEVKALAAGEVEFRLVPSPHPAPPKRRPRSGLLRCRRGLRGWTRRRCGRARGLRQ
jgi:hypothetical protein